MTIPQNVADAVERLDGYARVLPGLSPCVPTIRAHLMSQEAEIERLNAEWHEMFDRALLAESHLAAANALLRLILCWTSHE